MWHFQYLLTVSSLLKTQAWVQGGKAELGTSSVRQLPCHAHSSSPLWKQSFGWCWRARFLLSLGGALPHEGAQSFKQVDFGLLPCSTPAQCSLGTYWSGSGTTVLRSTAYLPCWGLAGVSRAPSKLLSGSSRVGSRSHSWRISVLHLDGIFITYHPIFMS